MYFRYAFMSNVFSRTCRYLDAYGIVFDMDLY